MDVGRYKRIYQKVDIMKYWKMDVLKAKEVKRCERGGRYNQLNWALLQSEWFDRSPVWSVAY